MSAAVASFRRTPTRTFMMMRKHAAMTPEKRCSTCNLREVCLPSDMASASADLEGLVYARRRIRRGEPLYRSGDSFTSLYAIRTGFLKSRLMLEDGRDQVIGFHMGGEVLGMDGIGTDRHTADTIALEDSEVCVIPYARLE